MAITDVRVYRMSTPERECPWGLKAIELLATEQISFTDLRLTSQAEVDEFKAKYQVTTTPQIFFGEERIGGYTDLAQRLQVEVKTPEYSYTPVIVLFSTAGLMTLATSLGMTGFMGISLSMLSALKLMDLNSFTAGFERYDLVAKHFKFYGRVYPLAELSIGLGFLSGLLPLATGIGSLVIGTIGGASVLKAVYIDKMALNCACIGGNSKAPLGIVSFAENAIMASMGLMLTFSSLTGRAIESHPRVEILTPINITLDRAAIN
jgi:glutaredoxin